MKNLNKKIELDVLMVYSESRSVFANMTLPRMDYREESDIKFFRKIRKLKDFGFVYDRKKEIGYVKIW